MLNFLNHFTVPGVEHVTVFHDDQDPKLFYMVTEVTSFLTRQDGSPAFTLISFARDFTLLADKATALGAAETEGGFLEFTTCLEVSQEDQQKIRAYIAGGMGNRPVPRLSGRRILLSRAGALPGGGIKLTYPTWVDGKVSLLFPSGGETFIKAVQGSEKPSLVNSNLASFVAFLGQEGVRLVRRSLEDGKSPFGVTYSVSFVARIPNLRVKVWGKSEQFYQDLKGYTQREITEKGTRYRFPQVSSLSELQNMSSNLHIEYNRDDFRAAGAETGGEDPTKAVENLVFEIVKQMVLEKFLKTGFVPGLDPKKLGREGVSRGPNGTYLDSNQLYLEDFSQTMEADIDFSFEGATNFVVEKHPSSGLFDMADPERIKKCITEADLSKPYFTLLDVPVQVTADFERDPIAAIKVFLEYDQMDEQGGGRKRQVEEFLFDSNDDRFYFRVVMARHPDGTPKDQYTYRSQIIYKASAKVEELEPVPTNDRNLVIGYDQLNCVNVAVYWGAIPADVVQQVQVSFRYPGVDLPSATADAILRLDSPQAGWFTYTGKNTSREYEYDVTFFMTDGQRITQKNLRSSTQRLIINAPFEDKLRATFVPQGSFPPVASIVVTASYVDGDYDVNDVHSFTNSSETWEWTVDLRDRAKRDFTYKVDVTYADGSSSAGEPRPGTEGTILVGDVAREMLRVEVVPALLDMAKWKLVIVRLSYADGTGAPPTEHIIQLTAAAPDPNALVWNIPLKDAARREFSYQIQAFGYAGEKHVVEPTPTTDPLLVLEF
ncbi:MAG: hypothetical protein IPJ61_04995 [Tessaracoccus sp.]|uniref:hypothetical protein n=1 Tax=Tessaracoccus sp. TaxID=1971211 RepID=UPI001EC48E4D|nr:hypothetical protein [Tessaracoccus sp.]MBK7820432.1 hypothetical protein [Tessaracoccus sp.]